MISRARKRKRGSRGPKKKKRGAGARPKKRGRKQRLEAEEPATEGERNDGDTENGVAGRLDKDGEEGMNEEPGKKTFMVSVNTPMHLCPYRQRNECRYGVCHDCFMKAQAGGGRRRKRKKNKERHCCHDDLESLKTDGEGKNYTAAYFDGPLDGGDLPTNCGLCGVSVVKRK